ncbi:MAG: hypothetical protein KTR21_13210, partial [Rhodobacteraceae bacterium]|nr:hypothetical protein [Paracoccaceae bacterium]
MAADDSEKHWGVVSDDQASMSKRLRAANNLVAIASRETILSSTAPEDVYVLPSLLVDRLPVLLLRVQTLSDTTMRLTKREALGPNDRIAF